MTGLLKGIFEERILHIFLISLCSADCSVKLKKPW